MRIQRCINLTFFNFLKTSSFLRTSVFWFWIPHTLFLFAAYPFVLHFVDLPSYPSLFHMMRAKLAFRSAPCVSSPSSSSPIVGSSNTPRSHVWSETSSTSLSVLDRVQKRAHPTDRRSFINMYLEVTDPSSGSCFAILFLLLISWHLFLETCINRSSFCNSFLLFLCTKR